MVPIIPGVELTELETCLLSLPAERSAAFLPTFARISVALQSVLRERVPVIYFHNPERYRDWKSAHPMLVYQASRPFRGRVRTELTYDVLNPRLMTILFRRAKGNLAPYLERVEGELRALGWQEAARHYLSRHTLEIIQSVQRLSVSRRCLYRLVRAESALVDALVDLSGLGALSTKEQIKRVASFRKKWQFQLRRFYPGEDFSALTPALLEAAGQAIVSRSSFGTESDVSLTFVSQPGTGGTQTR
jgi:hypothetical protein